MKFLRIILGVIAIAICCSCDRTITYSRYDSNNGEYSVEIPDDVTPYLSAGDMMSFTKDDGRITISIDRVDGGSIGSLCHREDGKFRYKVVLRSDSALFYKASSETSVLFYAYDMNMLKRVNGRNYLISYSSAGENYDRCKEVIEHMYNSLTVKENVDGSDGSGRAGADMKMRSYENAYFSIDYPAEWGYVEHITEMSDVMFSSYTETIASDIVRFRTDYDLEDIHWEETRECRENPDWHVISEEKTTMAGYECYRTSFSYKLGGERYYKITNTIKAGDMLYSVSFGNKKDVIEKYNDVVEKMVRSFRVK